MYCLIDLPAVPAPSPIDTGPLAQMLRREVLDGLQIPVFGLDVDSRICLVNRPGHALIRAGFWVTETGGVLGAAPTVLAPHVFKDALNRLRTGLGTTILLTEGSTRRQAVAAAVPLSGAAENLPAPSSMAGIVWIIPSCPESASVRSLGRLFKLTRCETALLDEIVHGARLGEAAASLHISIHTARTQLKAIFRKTERRTRSELLALANRLSMIRMSDDV